MTLPKARLPSSLPNGPGCSPLHAGSYAPGTRPFRNQNARSESGRSPSWGTSALPAAGLDQRSLAIDELRDGVRDIRLELRRLLRGELLVRDRLVDLRVRRVREC